MARSGSRLALQRRTVHRARLDLQPVTYRRSMGRSTTNGRCGTCGKRRDRPARRRSVQPPGRPGWPRVRCPSRSAPRCRRGCSPGLVGLAASDGSYHFRRCRRLGASGEKQRHRDEVPPSWARMCPVRPSRSARSTRRSGVLVPCASSTTHRAAAAVPAARFIIRPALLPAGAHAMSASGRRIRPPGWGPGARRRPAAPRRRSGEACRSMPPAPAIGGLDQPVGAAVVCQPAAVEDRHLGAGLGHVVEDVRGEEDRPVTAETGEQGAEPYPFLGVEAGRGLVHDDELGVTERPDSPDGSAR